MAPRPPRRSDRPGEAGPVLDDRGGWPPRPSSGLVDHDERLHGDHSVDGLGVLDDPVDLLLTVDDAHQHDVAVDDLPLHLRGPQLTVADHLRLESRADADIAGRRRTLGEEVRLDGADTLDTAR